MTVPNTRINSLDQIETALKLLVSQGYESAHAVWAEHNDWLTSLDARQVTPDDRTWAKQLPEPASTEEHFVDGQPEVLTAARCHVGRQYSLSPGQRDVLRERYGLTPTMVVEAVGVELFPTEDIIWSLTLKSAEHVDPRRRKHVLNEVVLCPASEFFRDAAAFDKEREEKAQERVDSNPKAKPTTKSLALSYLT